MNPYRNRYVRPRGILSKNFQNLPPTPPKLNLGCAPLRPSDPRASVLECGCGRQPSTAFKCRTNARPTHPLYANPAPRVMLPTQRHALQTIGAQREFTTPSAILYLAGPRVCDSQQRPTTSPRPKSTQTPGRASTLRLHHSRHSRKYPAPQNVEPSCGSQSRAPRSENRCNPVGRC
jgi:hypothetical protein